MGQTWWQVIFCHIYTLPTQKLLKTDHSMRCKALTVGDFFPPLPQIGIYFLFSVTWQALIGIYPWIPLMQLSSCEVILLKPGFGTEFKGKYQESKNRYLTKMGRTGFLESLLSLCSG